MLLRIAALSALVVSSYGSPLVRKVTSEGAVARLLEEAEEDAEEEEVDYSWMSGYTVKYENCFADKGVVSFRLCPADDKCESGCQNGGQYLVDFDFFLDAFTEAQLGAREYACEMVRENCEYDDEDECYQNGYSYCMDDDDQWDIQEYLECKEYADGLYIGPYCSSSDAVSIHLGMFTDEYCSVPADDSAFSDIEGYVLPYSATAEYSIIEDECANCREHGAEQDQNDGDQADEDDVLEQCEELYGDSSKCETDLDVENPDTSACGYLEQAYEEESAIKTGKFSWGSDSWNTWTIVFGVLLLILVLSFCGFCIFQSCNKKTVETTGPSDAKLI